MGHNPGNSWNRLKRPKQVIDAIDKERIRVGEENDIGIGFDFEPVQHCGVITQLAKFIAWSPSPNHICVGPGLGGGDVIRLDILAYANDHAHVPRQTTAGLGGAIKAFNLTEKVTSWAYRNANF